MCYTFILGLLTPASPQKQNSLGCAVNRRLHCHWAIGILQLHCNLMGPPLYVQSVVARNVAMHCMLHSLVKKALSVDPFLDFSFEQNSRRTPREAAEGLQKALESLQPAIPCEFLYFPPSKLLSCGRWDCISLLMSILNNI